MKTMRKILVPSLCVLVLCCFSNSVHAQAPIRQTENIIYVMTDGLRRQEVFNGADPAIMDLEHGKVKDIAALKKAYWRDSVADRRAALMAFLWTVVAQEGQIYGNLSKGSDAHVTNALNFSYPGYSETFCGFADPRVNSNDKVWNPNQTVLEWLNQKNAFRGRIAAFAAWDVMPYILNAQRSHLLVNAGYEPLTAMPMTPRLDLLNHEKEETPRFWEDEPFDPIPFYTALENISRRKGHGCCTSRLETQMIGRTTATTQSILTQRIAPMSTFASFARQRNPCLNTAGILL